MDQVANYLRPGSVITRPVAWLRPRPPIGRSWPHCPIIRRLCTCWGWSRWPAATRRRPKPVFAAWPNALREMPRCSPARSVVLAARQGCHRRRGFCRGGRPHAQRSSRPQQPGHRSCALGDPVAAERHHRRAIQLDPQLSPAYNNLGVDLSDKVARPTPSSASSRPFAGTAHWPNACQPGRVARRVGSPGRGARRHAPRDGFRQRPEASI